MSDKNLKAILYQQGDIRLVSIHVYIFDSYT